MIDKVLAELIDFVKSASPLLWETYVRQAYMMSLLHAIGGTLMFLVAIYSFFRCLPKVHRPGEDNSEWVAGTFISALFVAFAIYIMAGAVTRYLNPNYYAIQLIIETLKQ